MPKKNVNKNTAGYQQMNHMLNVKRKTPEEYAKMKKPELYRSLRAFIASYDSLKERYIELRLKANFLARRVVILEKKLKEKK